MILEVLAIAWIAKHFADKKPSEDVDIDEAEKFDIPGAE